MSTYDIVSYVDPILYLKVIFCFSFKQCDWLNNDAYQCAQHNCTLTSFTRLGLDSSKKGQRHLQVKHFSLF